MSDGKVPGVDGIWKHGGDMLQNNLLKLIQQANIVTIFKKGDRTQSGNYRRISLLSITGKAFAWILLNRLNVHITPGIVPETQCEFRNNRSIINSYKRSVLNTANLCTWYSWTSPIHSTQW